MSNTSDTTVIQPTPGQAIVTTRDQDGGHGRRGHDNDDWDRTILREQAAGFRTAAVDAQTTMRDIKDARHDVTRSVTDSTGAIRHDICDLGSAVGVVAKDTALGFKDLQALGYQVEGRALLEAAKNANALAVQADKNFYALSVEAVKNAAAAALAAEKCCCELKSLITSEGVSTRGLIDGNEKLRLNAQIVELQARLLRVPPLPV